MVNSEFKIYKKTRKAYLTEYTCGIFLLISLGIVALNNFQLNATFQYFVVGVSLFALGSAELARMFTRYKVSNDKLSIIKGIIQQDKKNVYFHPLGFATDLNIKQSRLQRLLNYGSIYLKSGMENTFEIKDVNSPHKILKLIEQRIEDNKTPVTSKKLIRKED